MLYYILIMVVIAMPVSLKNKYYFSFFQFTWRAPREEGRGIAIWV